MIRSQQEKTDITLVKGIGIFLVVVGHILARGEPENNEWFVELTHIIYLFHMPLFMAVSGYVYFRPGRVEKIWESYAPYVKKQAKRLIIPFFLIGLLVICGKLLASTFLHVDNTPDGFWTGVRSLFWDTGNSPATSVWYIYVLFFYTALCPVIFRFLPRPLLICSLLGIVLYLVPLYDYLYLDKFTTYFLFFVAGGLLRNIDVPYMAAMDRFPYIFVLIFLGSYSIWYFDLFSFQYTKLVVGLASIPAIHALCRIADRRGPAFFVNSFMYLGRYTLPIYMFNTICIGVMKGIIFKFTTWDGANFFVVAPALILAGLFGPLFLLYGWSFLWSRWDDFRHADGDRR